MSLDRQGLTEEEYEKSMGLLREAGISIFLRRIDQAIRLLSEDLSLRYSIQNNRTRRIHKGAAYYNLGVCYLFEEKLDENKAVDNFLLAYIEDCISNAPSTELAEFMDAARLLRTSLGIDPDFLTIIRIIISAKDTATLFDPREVLQSALHSYEKQKSISEGNIAALCKFRGLKIPRKIEFIKALDWEKRVFIGGNYATQTSNLLKIKEIVTRLGFEPVIVDDYVVPEDKVRHFSLMLLHSCKFAIFDITVAGGQYVEIERARDYGIKPLLVFSADSTRRESPFTSGLKMLEIENAKAYRDIETDLEPYIREYLSRSVFEPTSSLRK